MHPRATIELLPVMSTTRKSNRLSSMPTIVFPPVALCEAAPRAGQFPPSALRPSPVRAAAESSGCSKRRSRVLALPAFSGVRVRRGQMTRAAVTPARLRVRTLVDRGAVGPTSSFALVHQSRSSKLPTKSSTSLECLKTVSLSSLVT